MEAFLPACASWMANLAAGECHQSWRLSSSDERLTSVGVYELCDGDEGVTLLVVPQSEILGRDATVL